MKQTGHHDHGRNLRSGSGNGSDTDLLGLGGRVSASLRCGSRLLASRRGAGAQALHGGRQRPGHLIAVGSLPALVGLITVDGLPALGELLATGGLVVASELLAVDGLIAVGDLITLGLGATSECTLQLRDARPGGEVVALERVTQLCGHPLQGGNTTLQTGATLVDCGELGRERGPALLGLLGAGAGLLDAALEAIELGAVAAAQADGDLLGLDTLLLLGVLALLDAAQLAVALGELGEGALTLVLDLHLAAAEVGEVGLERADRRLGGLGAAEERLAGQSGASSAALGQQIASTLERGVHARSVISLGNHPPQSMGAVGRLGVRSGELSDPGPSLTLWGTATRPDVSLSDCLESHGATRAGPPTPRAAARPCGTAGTRAR